MSDSKSPIDHDLLRQLATLLNEANLTEIELEHDEVKIRLARHAGPAPQPIAAPPAAPPNSVEASTLSAAATDLEVTTEPTAHPGTVRSPMVGTAFHSPEPGAAPYIEVGSTVREGQTVLIVEAMKTMNQIPAPASGTVSAILVEDGQPVEYGDPLLIIE